MYDDYWYPGKVAKWTFLFLDFSTPIINLVMCELEISLEYCMEWQRGRIVGNPLTLKPITVTVNFTVRLECCIEWQRGIIVGGEGSTLFHFVM